MYIFQELDFGSVFLGHPTTRTLSVVNESRLPAKFEVLPEDAMNARLASVSVVPSDGTIPAKGEITLQVTLQAVRLGRVQVRI